MSARILKAIASACRFIAFTILVMASCGVFRVERD